MLDTRIILSATWITLMLIYLLGDVLRIYSGDFALMSAGQKPDAAKWLIAAIIMLIPILMVLLTLLLSQPISRWANIIVAIGFFIFVLADIGSYPSAYDKFLFIVSALINVFTVWTAWNWAA